MEQVLTLIAALEYPYLESCHDLEDEPIEDLISEEFFDLEKHGDDLSREQLGRKYSVVRTVVNIELTCLASGLTYEEIMRWAGDDLRLFLS